MSANQPVFLANRVPALGAVLAAYPRLVGAVLAVPTLLLLAWFYRYPYARLTSPFRSVPGPKSTSFLLGAFAEIKKEDHPNQTMERYMKEHGPTIKFPFLFGDQRLATMDPAAIAHVLNHDDEWVKPIEGRRLLARVIGWGGILVAEHETHRRMRRVLNPAFGQANIRHMGGMFMDKSCELKAKLVRLFENDSTHPTKLQVDMQHYISQAALDIIGLGGFGYDFAAVSSKDEHNKENEMAVAFNKLMATTVALDLFAIFQLLIPILVHVPNERDRIISHSKALMIEFGRKIVKQKREALLAQHAGQVEKSADVGRDLLSLIVKANMATDLRDNQKLSEDEVIDQIATFLVAGHETSSTTTAWALDLLATHPDVQDKLRAEVLAVKEERPDFDELNSLPYLDKVLREVFRFSGPVPMTLRHATRDTVIPLGTPIIGKDGKPIESIKVKKNTQIHCSLSLVNKSTELWGPDAGRFNPDRWDDPSFPLKPVPGVYAKLTTFGAGPHNCIGYRFAIAEVKSMLFVLLRTFKFTVPSNRPRIVPKLLVVMRPTLEGELEKGPQMPLMLELLDHE